jgi:hypothetical protein
MSFKAMRLVMESTIEGPSGKKFVLLALANRANAKRGYGCWPSQALIAKDTGITDRSVRAHMKALESEGFITRTPRSKGKAGRTSDWVVVNLAALKCDSPLDDADEGAEEVEPDDVLPEESSGSREPKSSNRKPFPVQPETISGEPVSEPSLTSPISVGAGAVSDSTTEAASHDGTVMEFPMFAREILDSSTTDQEKREWDRAWRAISSLVDTHWTPILHLTKYLARCKEMRRSPTPADWTRWFAEDEKDAADKAAKQRQQDKGNPTTNPYWE